MESIKRILNAVNSYLEFSDGWGGGGTRKHGIVRQSGVNVQYDHL